MRKIKMFEEYGHDEKGRARVVLPPQGLGKFIQLELANPRDYIFIGDRQNSFHSDILKKALERFELSFDEIPIEDGRLIVNPEGENYYLTGAGKTKRNGSLIEIGHKSLDYGIKFNPLHFNMIKKYFPSEIKFEVKDLIV